VLFLSGLAFKMVLTATVVVVTSLVVERSGPFLGALVGSFPVAAGAAYVILALDHPPEFIAASAIGSVAVNGDIAVFAAVYAMLAQRHGLFVSLGVASLVWFAGAAALRTVDWTLPGAVAISAVAYAVTVPLSWRYRSATRPVKFVRTRFDIPLRALTVALVVAVVTGASSSIGSFASGMFALFPIILGSAIVIMHPRIGGRTTASMMAYAQFPLMGLGFGFIAVHYLVAPIGVWPALGAGLLVCIAWSGALLIIQLRGKRRRAAISSPAVSP
jgi:uncharacterized membrane protein (GlpM family)